MHTTVVMQTHESKSVAFGRHRTEQDMESTRRVGIELASRGEGVVSWGWRHRLGRLTRCCLRGSKLKLCFSWLTVRLVNRMDEGTTGIVVLSVTSIVMAILCHLAIRRFLIASATAAVIATILFHYFAYLHEGYRPDPFFLIAIVVCVALSFAIALVVGVPFWLRRRPTRPD